MVNSVCTGTLLRSPNGAMLYLSDVVISSLSLKVMILLLVLCAHLLYFVGLSDALLFQSDAVIS